MQPLSSSPHERLRAAGERVLSVFDGPDLSRIASALDDDGLVEAVTDAASARDALDLMLAACAAEVTRRSSRDRGREGLAQRRGHRDGASLVQLLTGQTRADAGRAVSAGEELAVEGDVSPVSTPSGAVTAPNDVEVDRWRTLLRAACVNGRLSQAQSQAIRVGLGTPPVERYPELDPRFLPAAWARAVERLIDEADETPVEALRAAARTARDRLDPLGVTLRFEERYAARSFRTWTDDHGQRHGRFVFDDDAAMWVETILHAALRPRRGPRFVATADSADAETRDDLAAAERDDRTNEQLQYDTILAILRAGAHADPAQAFGDRQPGVRILVEQTALSAVDARGEASVAGVGHDEETGSALSGPLVETYLCDAGSTTLTFDHDHRPLDVGRDRRLFTRRQRVAIAARDGGCVWPSCTAPPSWCEYHHIDHWWEDHGRTDTDDGVPLCRHHHLGLHNQRWRISRERDPVTRVDTYLLHPPSDPRTGETLEPRRLRTRSPRRFSAA